MHDFRGAVAEAMDAEHFQGLGMEQDLEQAGGFLGHLCTRELAEVGLADLIGNLITLQFGLGTAHRTDLGNRIDAVGHQLEAVRRQLRVENVRDGIAALHIGGARQRRRPRDIAHGVDVGLLGLVVAVDLELSA